MKLLIIGLLVCFVAAAWGDDENDMYFTSSGDGLSHATDLPPDDEDTEEEASGLMPTDDGPVSTTFWETASPTTFFYSTLPNINQTAVYEEEGELFVSDTTEISVPPLRNVGGANAVPDVETIEIDIDPEEEIDIEEQPEEPVPVDKEMNIKNTRILEPDEEPVKKVDAEVNAAEQEDDGTGGGVAIASGGSQFLAAVIVGGCIGLLFAICVIMLLVFRMRKKDEGSYALEYGQDGKKPQGNYEYTKGMDSKEYFA